MLRYLVAIAFLGFACPVFAQSFPLEKKYEPLREAVSTADLRQFTTVFQKAKPDWYRAFFTRNPQFAAYREPACARSAAESPAWAVLGQGYFGLALVAQDRQRWDDFLLYAQVAYLRGIQELPACPLNFIGLGEIYLFTQKPAEALVFLREAETKVSDAALSGRLHLDLGIVFALLGQVALEKKFLSTLVPDPGLPVAYDYFLAHAALMEGDLAKAQEHILKASQRVPHSASFDPYPISALAVQTLQRLIDQAALRATSLTR